VAAKPRVAPFDFDHRLDQITIRAFGPGLALVR
jgi:hypothetical protein